MIIIPMAGKSSRFLQYGYDVPKYKLPLAGKTVFDWVVLSFQKYFKSQHFKFIVQSSFEHDNFTKESIKKLGILNYSIFELSELTRGQAETVYNAIIEDVEQEILIFNIDTIRKNFSMPIISKDTDGFLEIFKGEGDHWSFVEPLENFGNYVKRTTEKIRISNLCSNGMYYFKSSTSFKNICKESILKNEYIKGEFYIAPLYNKLIELGHNIEYIETLLEDNIFCGTPVEYEFLLQNTYLLNNA